MALTWLCVDLGSNPQVGLALERQVACASLRGCGRPL